MADKDSKSETAAAEAPKKKSKKMLFIIVGVVLLLVIGGGGAAFVLMGKKKEHAEEKKVEARKTPVFVDLDSFTVNLRSGSADEGDRFMQVKLVAEVKDAAAGEIVKSMMPAVRNEILLLLGGKTAKEVATREGKEQLAKDIVVAANKPLEGTAAAKTVESVNFTHLIVQ